MTFPPPQPPPPPPVPPHWPPSPPSAAPPTRQSSTLVPLLIVGAIAIVTLIAGAAAAVMIVMMNRTASRVEPQADMAPPTEAVAEPSPPPAPVAPETPVAEPERASDPPAPPTVERERERESPRERPASPGRQATAERARRPPASEEPAEEPVERAVRVGGNIAAPRKLRNVQPVYPQIAQSARVQGAVIIEATIDTRGHISDTRVLRSIPLLDQAALDAVRQWEYEPTLLNGVPVPVIMTVTVNFSLRP
jgi:periplasmic protein TonB